jgi:hypothetical protein
LLTNFAKRTAMLKLAATASQETLWITQLKIFVYYCHFFMLHNKKIFATVCLKEKAQYMHATFYSFSMKFGFCMEFAEVSFNQIKSIWIKLHFTAARQSQNTAFPLVCPFVHFFHFYSLASTNHSAQEHILSIH